MTIETTKRRSYTEAFKREAVALVTEQGYKIAEAARSLDIGANLLGRWRRQFAEEASGVRLSVDEREELKRLRKENRNLRLEKEILKKASLSSTGHRNTSLKFICGRTEIQSFPGPLVQAQCYLVQL